MQVILSGKSIDSKEEQPLNVEPLLNVESPIILIEFGKFIFCRREQITYLQPIITQYFIDNKSEIWLLFLIAHSKR